MNNTPENTKKPDSETNEVGCCDLLCRFVTYQDETCRFHGWTHTTHCPVGDGSMIYVLKLAVIEKPDGEVVYDEPHNITFQTAEQKFTELCENSDFERIKKTPDEQGWHYGPLKEKYPDMPEPQILRTCALLDAGWNWESYSCEEVILGCQIAHDSYEYKSIGVDGKPVIPTIESRMKPFA